MEKHYELSDLEFERQFEKGSLPSSYFSHEAHIRLAWIHIQNYGVAQACETICSQIANFDQMHGDGTKFNKTVTMAAVLAVNHFIQKSKSSEFKAFILEFPRLKFAFVDLLHFHYSKDIFALEQAKHKFLEPDLLPFQ